MEQLALANRNNNPGNLKDTTTGTFRQFNSPQEGYAALLNDLEIKKTGQSKTGLTPDSTLADFSNVYAPSSDKNNPAQYTVNLANHMKVRPDARLRDLDTGKWAEAVANAEGYKGQAPQTKPIDTTQEQQKLNEPNLGQQIMQRGTDIGSAVQETLQGKISPLSGVLQTVGGVAGMVGDVTGKALELIPGVKQVENLLGQGIGALAQTDAGKAVAKSISDFTKEHPELSKDIGAGFNIITAIPILRGLGALKNVALDATSSALKNLAEKSMAKSLTETLGRTVAGKKILARGGSDYVKTLIDERAIPEIIGNKYTTQDAFGKLGQRISDIDNNIYQPLLDKASASGGLQTSFVPLKNIEQSAIKLAQDELKDAGPIKAYFERLKIKYGDYPPINELNKAKRLVSKNISEAGFNSPTYSTDEIVRKSLQTAVEDGGRALGIPNIDAINQEMARLIKAQKILKHIEGKPVKSGVIGGFVKNATTVGGEIAGNATGIPIAGALTGRSVGGTIGKKLTGGVEGILKRTGKDATRLSKEELAKKMGLLFGGVASQKMNR